MPEACLELRRQVFARMEKCAEALEKLVKTRASLAESLDSSSKALEPRSKVLQQWLLGEAVPLVCGAISGDSPSDQSFRSPACNFVTSVLSDMVEILAQTASEEFDVAAWHGPLISRKAFFFWEAWTKGGAQIAAPLSSLGFSSSRLDLVSFRSFRKLHWEEEISRGGARIRGPLPSDVRNVLCNGRRFGWEDLRDGRRGDRRAHGAGL